MLKKMVLISGNVGFILNRSIGIGPTNPIGRFILENGKILPQILKSTFLPKGREKEAIEKYQTFLNNYIDPVFARAMPKDRLIAVLDVILPEDNPVKWLDYMWQAFGNCSGYIEQDATEYAPLDTSNYL